MVTFELAKNSGSVLLSGCQMVWATPTRISMMRPMPFWPSLEPWAKLTAVQVVIRMPRIHHGGDLVFEGSLNSSLLRTTTFSASNKSAAAM